MPWNAGWRPPSPGMNTDTVFREPALMISSSDDQQEDADLDQAQRDADRVEIEMPR